MMSTEYISTDIPNHYDVHPGIEQWKVATLLTVFWNVLRNLVLKLQKDYSTTDGQNMSRITALTEW